MKTYLEKCIGKKEKCSGHRKNDGLRCFLGMVDKLHKGKID